MRKLIISFILLLCIGIEQSSAQWSIIDSIGPGGSNISFSNTSNGCIYSYFPTLDYQFVTTNGGSDWRIFWEGLDSPQVVCMSKNFAVVRPHRWLTNQHKLYQFLNNGNFQLVDTTYLAFLETPSGMAVSNNNQRIIITSNFGLSSVTNNGGHTWRSVRFAQEIIYPPYLKVTYHSDDNFYISGNYPNGLWKSQNTENWSQISFPLHNQEQFKPVGVVSIGNRLIVVGYYGNATPNETTILSQVSGSNIWQTQSISLNTWPSVIANEERVIIYGWEYIWSSSDGLQWNQITSPEADNISSLGLNGDMILVKVGDNLYRSDQPLPIELSSFTSMVNDNQVILNWTTASETNNSEFQIERKFTDDWQTIGYVQGHGTSTLSQTYRYTDGNIQSGRYIYRLKQIDYNGNFEYYNLSNQVVVGLPAQFELKQNYPNPFNPNTTINFQLPVDTRIRLNVYDITGKEVRSLINDEQKTAGYYSINFDGNTLSSGIYYYRITAGNYVETKKMMLIK